MVERNSGNRLGIFGGTFDPVHLGHIGLARDALKLADLQKVIFIPARLQPFKLDKKLGSGEDRLKMLHLAVDGIRGLEVSDHEIRSDRVSYTYLTLKEMKERYGNDVKLFFITGTDSFLKIEAWKNAPELLSGYSFIVGARPGYREEELDLCIDRIHSRYQTEIIKISNVQMDISSTEIRKRLKEGISAADLIPAEVEGYIKAHGLYDEKPSSQYEDRKDRIREHLQASLTEKRLKHTASVVEEAKRLAETYGEDPQKAELAALFHDMFRSTGTAVLNMYVRQLGLPEKFMDNPNLSHGKIAAEIMKRDYGIDDEDILNAVSYHTTGRAGMSGLEKILFLADAIEPGRNYPTVEETRAIAYEDLDRACVSSLERTVEYIREIGEYLDPDTLDALKDLKENLDL